MLDYVPDNPASDAIYRGDIEKMMESVMYDSSIPENSAASGQTISNIEVPSQNNSASDSTMGITIISIKAGASSENGKGFEPASTTVSTGDTITWINDDTTLHTVTSGAPEGGDSGMVFDSSYLAAGKTFEYTFNNVGTYDYYCTLHPHMTGTIIVN